MIETDLLVVGRARPGRRNRSSAVQRLIRRASSGSGNRHGRALGIADSKQDALAYLQPEAGNRLNLELANHPTKPGAAQGGRSGRAGSAVRLRHQGHTHPGGGIGHILPRPRHLEDVRKVATAQHHAAECHRGLERRTQFGKALPLPSAIKGQWQQRLNGDPTHGPNPCLAPLEKAPFYAMKRIAGDIGTFLGLRVGGRARVLDGQGQPIRGLYAAGKDMTSVMGGTYPGAGITIGPALTFGYIAARHAAGLYGRAAQ